MDSNPNDGMYIPCPCGVCAYDVITVVTMLIVNSADNIAASEYESVYKSAGVDTVSYSPTSASLPASGWPTLGTLIDANTRLVNFLTTQADFTTAPYLIDGMLHRLVLLGRI